MIAGATPLIASPLLPVAAEPAAARVDESAKSEFAAMLSAMLTPAKVAPAPVRVTVETIVDATLAEEPQVEMDEETEPVVETTGRETAPATSAGAVSDVIKSTAVLDAEFADRLQRVIDRMRDAGHTVEVRETLRTPERQEALYAQGRTTTGPVVTWTRESRHIEGKAADVVIDGRSSGKGYALLHQIAQEEGLRTLGARDPGHLELPRTTVDAREGAAARRGDSEQVVRPLRQGGMLAQPARVAQVAQVAVTARVAVPGMSYGNGERIAAATGSSQRESTQAAGQGSSRQGAIRSGIAFEGATVVLANERNNLRGNGSVIVDEIGGATGSAVTNIARNGAATAATTATTATPASTAAATAMTAARAAVDRSATVVRGSVAARSAVTTESASLRGRAEETDTILATVPTEETGLSTERTNPDGTQTSARDQRTLGQQDARDASFGRGGRNAGESARDAARDASDARPIRQARARSAAALTAFATDVVSRSTFDPMREGSAMTGARMGDFGASAPIMRTGGLAAERVAELLAARDAQPAGTLGELRLAMDPVRDGLSEVRLALQNGALDATLRTSDAGIARGLRGEVATLTRSLERQGFDAARVSVQLDAAQQARATALDTVSAAEASARARGVRGDSDASLEGRDQQTAPDSGREQSREQQREQQHARQFGTRRQRQF